MVAPVLLQATRVVSLAALRRPCFIASLTPLYVFLCVPRLAIAPPLLVIALATGAFLHPLLFLRISAQKTRKYLSLPSPFPRPDLPRLSPRPLPFLPCTRYVTLHPVSPPSFSCRPRRRARRVGRFSRFIHNGGFSHTLFLLLPPHRTFSPPSQLPTLQRSRGKNTGTPPTAPRQSIRYWPLGSVLPTIPLMPTLDAAEVVGLKAPL